MREFVRRLRARGVDVRANIARTGHVSGISYRVGHGAARNDDVLAGESPADVNPKRRSEDRRCHGTIPGAGSSVVSVSCRDASEERGRSESEHPYAS